MSNNENPNETPVQNNATVKDNDSATTESSQVVHPQVAQQVEQPQPTQAVQPQVVQQTEAQPMKDSQKKKKFGLFEIVIGALVVFGGGYSVMNYFDAKPSTLLGGGSSSFEGAKVVIVNTDVLVSAVSLKVMNDPKSREKISILNEKIYQEIDSYAQQGYVVLDSDTPILHSPKADVTKIIAEKIGVDASEGYRVAKENNFIGNAGRATLDVKSNAIDDSNTDVKHEDFSGLDLNTNEKGETMDLDLE